MRERGLCRAPFFCAFVCDSRSVNRIMELIMFGFSLLTVLKFVGCIVVVHIVLFTVLYFYLGKVAAIAKEKLKKESLSE